MKSPTLRKHTATNFRFQDGSTLDLEIGYWTLGTLNAEKSNALIACHGASGDRDWALPFTRSGGAYDPDRWFVVSPDLPGGGSSSRATTTASFPKEYGVRDLTNSLTSLVHGLGLEHIAAFSGASLASLIGADLAASNPSMVDGLVLWNCGVRSDGYAGAVVDAICSSLALDRGERGMEAAVTAFLPSMLGRGAVAKMDAAAQQQFVDGIVTSWLKEWTAEEVSARYRCVANADLLDLHGGSDTLAAKLTCPILWLPSSSDMILPAASIETFARAVPSARVKVCPTEHGHVSTAASAGSAEFDFYDQHTADFLRTLKSTDTR